MANDLEQVSVELEARVARYRTDMLDSATVTEKSLTRIENSATRMERQVGRSFGNAAQQSRNLGYQISDIGVQLSSGTSPFIVLAQQGPQVANALEGARGAVGRFATFLSGPLGAAVLAATTLVGVWLSKNKEAGESIDDLVAKLQAQARQAKLNEQANDVFSRSIEGVTKAADDAEKAVDALRLAKKGEAQQTVESIKKNLEDAAAVRAATKARLDQAIAILELERSGSEPTSANSAEALAQQRLLNQRIESVKALRKELDDADKQAARLQKSLNGAISAQTVEQENASAAEKINRKFDAAIDRAAAASNASKKSQDALRAEIALINKAREAELKREADTRRSTGGTGSSGSDARVGDMTALIKQLLPNARITSTTGGKHTKGSDHYAGRAIDFVVPGMMNEAGTAMVRQLLEAAGVEIRRNAKGTEQFFGPGRSASRRGDHDDHFHVAWKGSPSPQSASRAQDTEERRRQTFDNELAQLLGDEIAAQRALVESAEEIAKLRIAEIETERQAYSANLDSLVEQKKLRADEAEKLRSVNDQIANYRIELVKRNDAIRQFRMDEAGRERDARLGGEARADEASVLQGRVELARTLEDRSAIERRILDLQYEEEKARNDYIIGFNERLKTQKGISDSELAEAEAAAKAARLRNASIGDRKANDLESLGRNNPFDRYLDDISDTKTRAQEATVRQLIEVRDGISDGLAEQLGIKSDYVKSLFSIFLDEAIFRPLAEAMRNRSSGGGGIFGSIIGAVSGLFGGGGGSTGSSLGGGLAGARAGGGRVEAGRLYRINESGMEGFVPASSGTVIPAGQMNATASSSQPTIVQPIINVDARGAVMNDQFARQILTQANQNAVQVAGQIGKATLAAVPGRMSSFQRDGT